MSRRGGQRRGGVLGSEDHEANSRSASAGRRPSAVKAMRKAEGNLAFFSGIAGLSEVAKENGKWNWCLVGPNPIEMPLSGGGARGVEEMKHAVEKHAHSFGLLRMRFEEGEEVDTKFVFVHASVGAGKGKFSVRDRGQAMCMEPQMERVIQRFCPFSAKVHIHSNEECTVEYLVDQLQVTRGKDTHLLTVENLTRALDQEECSRSRVPSDIVSAAMPRAEVAEPEPEHPTEMLLPKQRKPSKSYKVGDMVEVYSLKKSAWIEDAEVAEVVTESCVRDNFKVRAGSMKVLYQNRRRFKWVAPQQINEHLRPSQRPKPPEARVGKLLKETYDQGEVSWELMHVELNLGYLQWWERESDAREGKKAGGAMYLLGMELHEEHPKFQLKSHNTKGTVYTFRVEEDAEEDPEVAAGDQRAETATLPEAGHEPEVSAEEWAFQLWEHAGFCVELHQVAHIKSSSRKTMDELLVVSTQKRNTETTHISLRSAESAHPDGVHLDSRRLTPQSPHGLPEEVAKMMSAHPDGSVGDGPVRPRLDLEGPDSPKDRLMMSYVGSGEEDTGERGYPRARSGSAASPPSPRSPRSPRSPQFLDPGCCVDGRGRVALPAA